MEEKLMSMFRHKRWQVKTMTGATGLIMQLRSHLITGLEYWAGLMDWIIGST